MLVNNAGLSRGLETVQEGDPADWEEMIDTNIKGLLWVTRAVLPGMIARDRGHVINIGSVSGHDVYPGGAVYCGTKYAVHAVTTGLRIDVKGSRVRVTTVDPGMVESEFSLVRFHGDEERADAVYRNFPPLKPEDVADAVLYCATRPEHVNVGELILWPTDQKTVTISHPRASTETADLNSPLPMPYHYGDHKRGDDMRMITILTLICVFALPPTSANALEMVVELDALLGFYDEGDIRSVDLDLDLPPNAVVEQVTLHLSGTANNGLYYDNNDPDQTMIPFWGNSRPTSPTLRPMSTATVTLRPSSGQAW